MQRRPSVAQPLMRSTSLVEEPLNYMRRLMFGCALLALSVMFVAIMMAVSNRTAQGGQPALRAASDGDGSKDRAAANTKAPAALDGDSAKRRFSKKTIKSRGGSKKPVTQNKCGTFWFKYCPRKPSGGGKKRHYYDAATKSCGAASPEVVYVCPRGLNRFVSLEHCQRSCAGTRQPTRRCPVAPVFTACTGHDVKHDWWFPDGKGGCSKWKFPKGHCPGVKSPVFKTKSECIAACAPREHDGNETAAKADDKCKPAKADLCAPKQLRYPFFAVLNSKGHGFECLEASAPSLSHRQCLAGANAFETAAECNKTCTRHRGR